MSTAKSIVKNAGFVGVSRVITSLLGFILLIYIARYFGEAAFGEYNFAISFSTLFIIFADLGISQFIIRELARNKGLTARYLTNVSIIRIILSFLAFGFIAITINLMGYSNGSLVVVYLFGLYIIINSFTQTVMSIFQAFEKMEYSAFILILQKILLIILTFLVFYLHYGILELAYAHIISELVGIFIGIFIILIKIEKPKLEIDISLCKLLIVSSIPFGLNDLFGMIFFKIDTVMLSYFKSNVEVGIYNAAYNPLLTLSILISNTIVSAIYPVMSRNFISSKDSLESLTVLSSKYLSIIGFPIATGCFLLANQFIALFYASQYSGSVIAFQILSLFIPLRLVSHITGTLLSSMNLQKFRTISVGFSCFANVLLNAVLIPKFGYIGASIATVLSEILLYFALTHYINKNYKRLELHKSMIKPLIASLIMGGFVFYFKESNLFLLIILAALFYMVILVALGMFTKKEIDTFDQFITKRLRV
jgi:O-antigen/teichoic acid export membrane protein